MFEADRRVRVCDYDRVYGFREESTAIGGTKLLGAFESRLPALTATPFGSLRQDFRPVSYRPLERSKK